MARITQVGDALVGAIRGQRVLGQVIRPDGKEIRLARKLVGQHGRRRHFDHHADLQRYRDRVARRRDVPPGALQFRLGRAQLFG